MVLMRGLAALAAVAFIAATAAMGCTGLSASDSETRCTQERLGKSYCFDTNVFNSCVSCYERCGNDCTAQGLCPEQYLCPGEMPVDAGSDAL
jgi:hypothetical protein